MEKYHNIHWKKGLDITPEIFVASDNYHITERTLLGRFSTFRLYGISPDRKFHIEKSIDNSKIYIKNLECLAITRSGYLINMYKDTPFNKELNLSETAGIELYAVLTVNPYSAIFPGNQENQACPEYNIILKRVEETVENGIPVLKIYKNNTNWEIDNDYIPPSVALCSMDTLNRKCLEIKNIINKIIEKLPKEEPLYLQIIMLQLELNNCYLQKSPQELIQLLKKFCWIFQLYLKAAKNIKELPVIQKFVEKSYDHLEIGNVVTLGLECLTTVDQLTEKAEETIMEIKI